MRERKVPRLTQERLKELLDYNQETGVFTWRVSSYGYSAGQRPNCVNVQGYIQIGVDYEKFTAHRLAFLYMEGYWTENEIDHINRNRQDNSWNNLREVGRVCNSRNSQLSVSNTPGVKGVYYRKDTNKWFGSIKVNYKTKTLGCYDDFVEAVAHRLAAESCLDWQTCEKESSAYQYMQKYLNGELNDKVSD